MDNIKRWLRTVLQNYKDPDRTFRDVDAVLTTYISLKPEMNTFTYNDGNTQLLLCLYGTIPITYRSIPYNIPVAFWIPSEYPNHPPIPFVKPTANMLVREGKHVDKSGLCYHPYRSSWQTDVNKHTLLELVAILQQVFGQEPPVYTKPPSTSSPASSSPMIPPSIPGKINSTNTNSTPPPPPPPPLPVTSTSTPSQPYSPTNTSDNTSSPRWHGDGTAYYNIHQGLAAMSLSPGAGYATTSTGTHTPPPIPTATTSTGGAPRSSSVPAMPKARQPTTPTSATIPPHTPSSSLPSSSLPRESQERELQENLYRKVSDRMQAFNIAVSNEMDKLLMINRQLNDGEFRIDQEQQVLMGMIRRLQDNIQILRTRGKEIEEITSTVNSMPDLAVDEALCGTTVVYNQLFDLVADDNAIVDTIYYLGKALNTERIDLVTFMKCTRTLAREQFMKRALMKKICDAAAQQ
ncbi:UEV domain-containing protein [Phascolomyces articulosus]|uniref:UEV domain-containing protein n=1 Tax=Phascolomyces articulosus TaxID=60185 RepID=A0AAD5PE66_9FUNG|nr:UEV domain-containing protein [Phascolomyces articulosus]